MCKHQNRGVQNLAPSNARTQKWRIFFKINDLVNPLRAEAWLASELPGLAANSNRQFRIPRLGLSDPGLRARSVLEF
jgi:hypothetical protein